MKQKIRNIVFYLSFQAIGSEKKQEGIKVIRFTKPGSKR